MSLIKYICQDYAQSTLLSSITSGALSFQCQAGQGALFPSTFPYFLVLETISTSAYGVESVTAYEQVKVTARSTDTFTIVRAQNGTSATDFGAWDRISLHVVSAIFTDMQEAIQDLETDKLDASWGLRTWLTAWRLYYSNWSWIETPLSFGTSGYVLQTNGASSAPTWVAPTVDITWLTEDTSPDEASDFLIMYDTSAWGNKKVKPNNIDNNITGKTALTSADTGDEMEIRDTSASANKKITKNQLLSPLKRAIEWFYYFNDFIGTPLLTGPFIWVVSAWATVSETQTSSAGTWHVGAWRWNTWTTSSWKAAVFTSENDFYLWLWLFSIEMRVRVTSLSNSSGWNRFDAIFGLFDTTSSIDQVDGVYFLYDEAGVATGAGAGSANWKICGVSNSSRTITTTSTAVSTTYVRLRIDINAWGTSAEFFVNDVSVGTVATNIPTGTSRKVGAGTLAVKNAWTGSGRGTDIDYVAIDYTFTSAR